MAAKRPVLAVVVFGLAALALNVSGSAVEAPDAPDAAALEAAAMQEAALDEAVDAPPQVDAQPPARNALRNSLESKLQQLQDLGSELGTKPTDAVPVESVPAQAEPINAGDLEDAAMQEASQNDEDTPAPIEPEKPAAHSVLMKAWDAPAPQAEDEGPEVKRVVQRHLRSSVGAVPTPAKNSPPSVLDWSMHSILKHSATNPPPAEASPSELLHEDVKTQELPLLHPPPANVLDSFGSALPIPDVIKKVVGGDQATLDTADVIKKVVSGDQKSLDDTVSRLVSSVNGAVGNSSAERPFKSSPFGKSVFEIMDIIKVILEEVTAAHKRTQSQLNKFSKDLESCDATKKTMVAVADESKAIYEKYSPLHKHCRGQEALLMISRNECDDDLADKKKAHELNCKALKLVDEKLGTEKTNTGVVARALGEQTESYLDRISNTFCGTKHSDCSNAGGNECGTPQCGYRCQYQCAKNACDKAAEDIKLFTEKCQQIQLQHDAKVTECNNVQDIMDGAACKRAVDMKDACETYEECHTTQADNYNLVMKVAKVDEDEHAKQWTGLQKIDCLLTAFKDGSVKEHEVADCKAKDYDTSALAITYPHENPNKKQFFDHLSACSVPKLYPSTGEYKLAEFAPLPALAKGQEGANDCTGVVEIPTTPAIGSPESCKCTRVTMNGPYSAGPVVKCVGCLDTHKVDDPNSCPTGTKIFSPRTREDWNTFISSAEPLQDPNWIIDITRREDGCGACNDNEMNSGNTKQKSWITSDGSAWWLRSSVWSPSEKEGEDYQANCYMDLGDKPEDSSSVTWKQDKCNYHSKSYYCQLAEFSTTPAEGSPEGCVCEKVELTGQFSAGLLIKCTGCLDVSKSKQTNSCPEGTKIFSPRTRRDWKTIMESTTPLRSPNWIIDITHPEDGCGECNKLAMNTQGLTTWKTSDGSPWWLRSTGHTQPSGDYSANCYLNVKDPIMGENHMDFDDSNCDYHSNSYFCQPVEAAPSKKAALIAKKGDGFHVAKEVAQKLSF